jgi:hypothetical protein
MACGKVKPADVDLIAAVEGNSAGETKISHQATILAKIERLQLGDFGALNLYVAGFPQALLRTAPAGCFTFGVASNEQPIHRWRLW